MTRPRDARATDARTRRCPLRPAASSAAALLAALVVAGCATASGFDRGALRAEIASAPVVTDADIANALAAKPQLPAPFRLAVHFAPPTGASRRWDTPPDRWESDDRRTILDALDPLRASGAVSEIVPIGDGVVEGTDRRAIRLGAARAGCDAVLVVRGVSSIDDYNNSLGITYVLIVTPLFVPGSVVDALYLANASLWDVRNDYLYLSSEAEGTSSQTRPGAFKDEEGAVEEAKRDALAALAKDVAARLGAMR